MTTPAQQMPRRPFGRTGLEVSELGFGAWAIGGQAYGAVARADALEALQRAEELGCNFVDTAMVYGDSETILGEFLRGRRERWIVCTKYSGQPEGLERTLESQLQRLGTEAVDVYLIHWAPRGGEDALYEQLERVKAAGKARFVGVSLRTLADVSYVLKHARIDAFQVPFSLLAPDPVLAKLDFIRRHGPGIVVRSSLREGFLTGKFGPDARFTDPTDQRHEWSAARIRATVEAAERFRFVEKEAGSMLRGAVAYPLSFPEVSTVILGTKSRAQADLNFGTCAGARLTDVTLAEIARVQRRLGLRPLRPRLTDWLRNLLG